MSIHKNNDRKLNFFSQPNIKVTNNKFKEYCPILIQPDSDQEIDHPLGTLSFNFVADGIL